MRARTAPLVPAPVALRVAAGALIDVRALRATTVSSLA
jgi:hypothetical protein